MSLSRRTFLWLTPLTVIVPTPASGQASLAVPATGRRHRLSVPRPGSGAGDGAVSHGNAARVRELLSSSSGAGERVRGLGLRRLGVGARRRVARRQPARLPAAPGCRRASDDLLGGDAGPGRDVKRVRRRLSRRPEDARPARLTAACRTPAPAAPAAADVVKFLESLGDADPRYTNEPLTGATGRNRGIYAFGAGATERLTVAAGSGDRAFSAHGRVGARTSCTSAAASSIRLAQRPSASGSRRRPSRPGDGRGWRAGVGGETIARLNVEC